MVKVKRLTEDASQTSTDSVWVTKQSREP